jgi:hypothetical protein
MQSAYPAGRDIYLSALVFILRQMVRFWQTGLPEIAAFDRPRARLFAGQPGVCERPVRHAKPGRAGPIAQPRFDDDGDPAIADRPSRLHRACTFVLLPPPLGRLAVAGGRQRQRQLSKGFHFFPVSLVWLAWYLASLSSVGHHSRDHNTT